MEILSIIGMIAALALLSFLVMKGVNIFIAAIVSSLLVAITGQIGLYDALQNDYMSGFTSFFGSNFLIFVAGALMGQVYEKTNGAKAIARLIIKGLGKAPRSSRSPCHRYPDLRRYRRLRGLLRRVPHRSGDLP